MARPIWLTYEVLQFANWIKASQRWEQLPFLADMLEEAGCNDVGYLAHFRHEDHRFHYSKRHCPRLESLLIRS